MDELRWIFDYFFCCSCLSCYILIVSSKISHVIPQRMFSWDLCKWLFSWSISFRNFSLIKLKKPFHGQNTVIINFSKACALALLLNKYNFYFKFLLYYVIILISLFFMNLIFLSFQMVSRSFSSVTIQFSSSLCVCAPRHISMRGRYKEKDKQSFGMFSMLRTLCRFFVFCFSFFISVRSNEKLCFFS